MPALNRWGLPFAALVGGLIGAGAMYLGTGGGDRDGVRHYLLAHPEVIPEAMQKLQDRESGKLVAAHRDAITRPYRGGWAGNPNGDVTVVEYFDYNCGYCRAGLPTLQALLDRDPGVRVVYRELPILAESSRAAARASLAAAAAGPAQYGRFHHALYEAGPVSDATVAAAARVAGIDPAAFPPDAEQEIDHNLQVSSTLGLNGTPSWVIGDRVLSGAQSLDALQEAVKAARGQ